MSSAFKIEKEYFTRRTRRQEGKAKGLKALVQPIYILLTSSYFPTTPAPMRSGDLETRQRESKARLIQSVATHMIEKRVSPGFILSGRNSFVKNKKHFRVCPPSTDTEQTAPTGVTGSYDWRTTYADRTDPLPEVALTELADLASYKGKGSSIRN